MNCIACARFQDTELAPMHGAKAFMEFIDENDKRRRPEASISYFLILVHVHVHVILIWCGIIQTSVHFVLAVFKQCRNDPGVAGARAAGGRGSQEPREGCEQQEVDLEHACLSEYFSRESVAPPRKG